MLMVMRDFLLDEILDLKLQILQGVSLLNEFYAMIEAMSFVVIVIFFLEECRLNLRKVMWKSL